MSTVVLYDTKWSHNSERDIPCQILVFWNIDHYTLIL